MEAGPTNHQITAVNAPSMQRAREDLAELSQFGVNMCANIMFEALPAVCEDIQEFAKLHEKNLTPDVVLKFISAVQVADGRSAIESACVRVMQSILAMYSQDFLPLIFEAVPEASHLRSRYELTQEYITHQSINGQTALKREMAPVYAELTELSRVQEYLMSTFQQFHSIVGDNRDDWANVAVGFGANALAAANPIVGIPLLIARWINEDKRGTANQHFAAQWWAKFQEYCERWDRLWQLCQPVFADQCQFITDKINRLTHVSIPAILSDLDKAGFNLARVPVRLRSLLDHVKAQQPAN